VPTRKAIQAGQNQVSPSADTAEPARPLPSSDFTAKLSAIRNDLARALADA